MIRVRLASLGSNKGDRKIEILNDETIVFAMARALEGIPEETPREETFQVLLNGHKVEPELWASTKLKESDVVLIAPKIKGGDNNLIRSAGILAITIVAYAYLGPGGSYALSGLALGAAMAGISIASTMLLYGLFPPPVLDSIAGGDSGGISESQMYTITNQANTVRKLGTVPKIYGTHRIFPIVAANPYTEIAADPSTGQLVSYFYGIYDFGLGPMDISQLKIGDTPITAYNDIEYKYVDLNKPATSEGFWDDKLQTAFTIYKGTNSTEQLGLAINKNSTDGTALDTYEATRNSAENPENYEQEITLTFLNPRGLYAYTSTGVIQEREIVLEVYFQDLENPNGWRAYNDLNDVNYFDAVGGSSDFEVEYTTGPLPDFQNPLVGPYTVLRQGAREIFSYNGDGTVLAYQDLYYIGYPVGSTQIIMRKPVGADVSKLVYWNGTFIGEIDSVVSYGPDSNFGVYTLKAPIPIEIVLYEVWKRYDPAFVPNITYRYISGIYALEPYPTFPNGLGRRKNIIGRFVISRADINPVYSTLKFKPKTTSQVAIRVTRISSSSAATSQISDNLSIASINTRYNNIPIVTDKRHLFMEIKIRATNQLNGSISNMSAICSSVLDVPSYPDGATWTKEVTSNPAWIFADLLTGEINKRAISRNRLHLPTLFEWSDFCDEIPERTPSIDWLLPRFQANFVLDYPTTVQSLIGQITGAAQASMNIIDGKYGVLIDKRRDTPIQVFTPRNSRGFSSVKNFSSKPHALAVKFIDPLKGWEISEAIVYDTGYDVNNAEIIEDITSFGVTNYEQAYRFGRYILAQNRLRQETITIEVDFEHLVCTRGDYVKIVQDPMLVGGTAARVKSISGNQIVIDEGLETSGSINYGFTFRNPQGQFFTNTCTAVFADTWDLDGVDLPTVGDLIVIGEVDYITYDCLVKSIQPNDDLSATITLVEKADAIYDSESTDTLPDYNPGISQTSNPDFAPPGEVENLELINNTWRCFADGYEYYVDIDWDEPTGATFEYFEIFVNSGRGFESVGNTRVSDYRYIVDEDRVGLEHQIKVLAVSATGKKLNLLEVAGLTFTPESKSTPPSDVNKFSSDITGETLQLSWVLINDCDAEEYLIRYNPTLVGSWENSMQLLRVDRNTNLATTQARTGTYLIKAIDRNGNESENAATIITTIPQLFNLNIIETITDFPTLTGSKERTVVDGDTLQIQPSIVGPPGVQEYFSDGYYYYNDILDLGDIYTVRLQSLINAEGYSPEDLMSNWTTLDSVLALSNSTGAEWDVEAEYRTSDVLNVIEQWNPLSDVEYMSSGDSGNLTEWKKFTIGDATGRVFQFRLRLVSYQASVTPRVFDGTIRADMPDRSEVYNNVSAPDTGVEVTYTPKFKGPTPSPGVQITMEDGASGDYWVFTSKTLEGFVIRFYDVNDNPVARTFDAQVKGFGRGNDTII